MPTPINCFGSGAKSVVLDHVFAARIPLRQPRIPAMTTMVQTSTETSTCSSCGSFGSFESEVKEEQPCLEDKARMPPVSSLLLIHYFLILCTVNLVITIPTANEYAERLGAGRLFAGLMIGCLPILSIAGNLCNQKLFACLPFKTIWVICSLGTVLGSVLYALAGLMRFKWTLLISRGLMGFFSAFSLPGIYVSHTVGVERRSEVLFYFSAVLQLGCAAGPALAAMLEASMKFIKINNLVLDSDTIPGWFMAAAYLFFTVKIILCLKDLPPNVLTREVTSGGRTLESPKTKNRMKMSTMAAACAMFWQLFVSSAVITGVEVYTINVARHHMGWSIESSAWFVAILMLISGVFNLSLGKVIQCMAFNDITGLLMGTFVACLSCVFLFNFDLDSQSWKVSLLSFGLISVLVTNGLTRALALSICSKLVPAEAVNSIMTWATVAMSLGRGGGSIICAVLNPDSFAPVLLGLFAVTLMFSWATRKYMKPDMKAS
ncbi:unnamed protein product [Durusdinium trenchii]|uniref:Major facilitator superfamily (MFS) profile domain-containing protein n=1 Tax=Durusdinium trenchii TaxID=1381693 RepID=A0ABP0HSC7_9DINO